jgi:integrase
VARGEFTSAEAAPPEAGVTAQTGSIAATLMLVARHHCQLPTDVIERLAALAADVQPRSTGTVTRKNRDRLRQFDDPAVRARLLHLPPRLMRQAEALSDHPKRAALLAMTAVAIELLLHVPLRISNLTALKLGEHLRYDGGRRGRITHLTLAAHETKNKLDVEWSVGPELAAFIERYVSRFRPALAAEGSLFLFPAGRTSDRPLAVDTLRYHIVRKVRDEVGAVINPHLFRSLVARLTLEHAPGSLEDVRQLLGDKSMATVLAHYTSIEPSHAARRHDDMLRRARGCPKKPSGQGRSAAPGGTR